MAVPSGSGLAGSYGHSTRQGLGRKGLWLVCGVLVGICLLSCKGKDRPPESLDAWDLEVATLNGLEIEPGMSHLSLEDGRWVADFRDLPLWNLPIDGGSVQIGKEFPYRARVDGAHLCGKLDRRVERWLDTAAPGWKKVQKCDAKDLEKSLRNWAGRKSGVEDLEFSKDSAGRITGAKVVCRAKAENELAVGRLQILPDLRSLELEDCWLATPSDSSGATSMVQDGFAGMRLRTLRLRRIQAPFLDLSDIRPLDTLEIVAGDATALEVARGCPREIPACRDKVSKDRRAIRLVQSRVCDPRQVRALQREGAVFEEQRCEEVPIRTLEQADSLVEEFYKLQERKAPFRLNRNFQVGSHFQEMFTPLTQRTWSIQRLGDVACARPYRFVSTTVYGGEGWVRDPWWGTIVTGGFERLGVPWIVAGADRKKVAEPFLRPFLESKSLEVRINGNGPAGVFQYDLDGKLATIGFPTGCFVNSWVDDVKRIAR